MSSRKQHQKRPQKQSLSLKRELRGSELKPGPHPPEFTSRPWFNLVVRIEDIAGALQLNQILAALHSQLAFPETLPLYVRLRSIRVWGPLRGFNSTDALSPLSVSFFDFISENNFGTTTLQNRVLEQYTRYPDQTRRASVGYEYPIAHQNLSLWTTTGVNILLASLLGAGPGSVMYVYLMFRSGSTIPSPAAAIDPPVEDEPSKGWFKL
jgi:hypothetical protein